MYAVGRALKMNFYIDLFVHPQWGMEDTEIKEPSAVNEEPRLSEMLSFKVWCWSEYRFSCFAYFHEF